MRSFDAYARFQVRGNNLQNIISGLGSFWRLANRYMIEEGLGTSGPDGLIRFELGHWYPMVSQLRVLERVRRDMGEVAVRQAAAYVPMHALYPPDVVDIHSAFQRLDMAYHMNHGLEGRPLFEPLTGVMQEGIGHYLTRSMAERKQLLCECSVPYPCCFDESLLLTLARRFEPSASLVHLETAHCRDRSGARCSYLVSWT
ncbi:hypothetical protein [Melittangium boletus]|uniref:hypothetical protein n=1 Tax=Melittangium boletus TaxID=83453 RepID=UPI003DA68042